MTELNIVTLKVVVYLLFDFGVVEYCVNDYFIFLYFYFLS